MNAGDEALASLNLPLAMLGLAARSMATWLEMPQSLCQPFLDLQGQWLSCVALQTGWPAFLPRGIEQLA
jgi:hypothetical protein